MPSFTYTARTRSGESASGTVEANDRRSAVQQLDRMGYVPVTVAEATDSASPTKRRRARDAKNGKSPAPAAKPKAGLTLPAGLVNRAPRMGLRDVLLLTRELSDLLASGMTLGNALHTLTRRETSKAQDAIVQQLRDDIVQGASLSEALKKHPTTFSALYVSMVRAGEASGTLPEVLERLCYHYERVQDARERVVMALVYPLIIMLVGAGTMIFTMVFVIPRFNAIFDELGGDLPGATQVLVVISDILMNYWWAIILGGIGLYFVFRRVVSTPTGLRWWHGIQLRVPIVKNIISANAFAHFARTLGALLANGVPVLSALSIVEETVGNQVIADEIRGARDLVTDGATISGPLADGHVFPPLLTDMLAVGEQSGDMSGALSHIANRYDRELDHTVKIFTTVLEPIMILVMAVLVGFVAISMLMAVFDITSGLNV